MTENEVNLKCRDWLISQGYAYKGVLNDGKGDVPVPDGYNQVRIDHQGIHDRNHDLIWVEAKGSNAGMSDLLEGFIRMVYGCWHGAGRGLLAIPSVECERMLEQRDFLKRVGVSCERKIGILDAGKGEVHWLI